MLNDLTLILIQVNEFWWIILMLSNVLNDLALIMIKVTAFLNKSDCWINHGNDTER